jgi:hypothetical protein
MCTCAAMRATVAGEAIVVLRQVVGGWRNCPIVKDRHFLALDIWIYTPYNSTLLQFYNSTLVSCLLGYLV